jgi:hypothetical protein
VRRNFDAEWSWWIGIRLSASPAEASCELVWKGLSYNRCESGSGSGAGRESEAVVVPIEPRDNTTCGELDHCGASRCRSSFFLNSMSAWRVRPCLSL